MQMMNELWKAGARIRNPQPTPRQYAGGFKDRQSRFDIRRLKRYGDFVYDVPLVVLWVDDDSECDGVCEVMLTGV